MLIVRSLSFGDRPPLHLFNRIMRDTPLNLPEHFSVPRRWTFPTFTFVLSSLSNSHLSSTTAVLTRAHPRLAIENNLPSAFKRE